MNKLIGIAVALVVSLALALPAQAVDVGTGVTVTAGGGTPPLVKCKWETPDDGDPTHSTPGTQILPSGQFQVDKPVQFYAVVTDAEGVATVDRVYADVWHPLGPPENGSFKYQLQMSLLTQADGLAFYATALAQGLLALSDGMTLEDIQHELDQGLARVWAGSQVLSYHQPWGDYRVQVKAYDRNNNPSLPLINFMHYVQTTACEFDFTAVDYGSVEVCINKWIGGDTTFGTALLPTVRNIGNTNANVTVSNTDMGFGQTSGVWNVVFDAKLSVSGTEVVYNPAVTTTIPTVLPLCNTQKLDFSIHVKKADPGVYSGTMTLGCVFAPF